MTDDGGATGTASTSVTTTAPATPPTATVAQAAAAIVTATGTATSGGTVSYSISQTSGTTTAPLLISAGKWAIPRHGTDTLVYSIVTTESPSGLTDTKSVSVTPGSATTTGDEVYTRNAGNTAWI